MLDEEMTNTVHVSEERAHESHPPTPSACWADTGGKLGLGGFVEDPPSSLVSIRCPTECSLRLDTTSKSWPSMFCTPSPPPPGSSVRRGAFASPLTVSASILFHTWSNSIVNSIPYNSISHLSKMATTTVDEQGSPGTERRQLLASASTRSYTMESEENVGN